MKVKKSPSNQECEIDSLRISYNPFLLSYFNELNHIRRDYTFPTFVNRTDEKKQTEKILSEFLNRYLSKYLKDCSVLDIGHGEGDLSIRTGKYMDKKCDSLLYSGIDLCI